MGLPSYIVDSIFWIPSIIGLLQGFLQQAKTRNHIFMQGIIISLAFKSPCLTFTFMELGVLTPAIIGLHYGCDVGFPCAGTRSLVSFAEKHIGRYSKKGNPTAKELKKVSDHPVGGRWCGTATS